MTRLNEAWSPSTLGFALSALNLAHTLDADPSPVVCWVLMASSPNKTTTNPSASRATRASNDSALSVHLAVSCEFIKNSGGFAVRVNPHDKAPAKGWRPKDNDKNLSELILRDMRAGVKDNLGIHLFGPLVDVDVDSDSPSLMAALERFLPPCGHVWGRAARPRTHRVYQLRDDFDPERQPVLRKLKRIEEVKLELRGGHQSNGTYSVVPGSIHPSGEEYLWSDLKAARSSLSVIEQSALLRAVRLAGAIAVIAPYWQEGMRNDLVMALSGFLYRTSKIAEALDPDESFSMDRATAEHFLQVLLDVTLDDPKDYRARYKTFEATWSKAEKDVPTTGGNTLGKITGDEKLLGKLYSLLCDSPDISILDEFTERFAVWSGPGLIIDMEAAMAGVHKPFMTRQQFCNSFGHRFIETGGHRKLVADLLFHMPTTMRLAGVTFEPGKEKILDCQEGRKVNQWSGFQVPPHPEPVTARDIKPFLSYLLEVIASSKRDRYKWTVGWLAHIFREPADKSGTALVLVGAPGAGKSFLGEHFLVPLIGNHAVVTNSIDRAVQGFNALFDNRIFVQCDEALSNRQRQTAARLKSLITDPTIIIEPKGIDPYSKPNHMRLLFTSNETRDAVFLTDGIDDRRYTVLEVSDVKKGKIKEYWMPLVKWARDKINLAKIHRYFLDYDYDRALISKPIHTQAKTVMQEHSMPVFDRWLGAWISRGHPLAESTHKRWHDAPREESKEIERQTWPTRLNYTTLAADYALFIRSDASRGLTLNGQQVKAEFRKRGFHVDGHIIRIVARDLDMREQKFVTSRIFLHLAPTQEEVRAYLKRQYGAEYDEMKDDEEVDDEDEKGEEF